MPLSWRCGRALPARLERRRYRAKCRGRVIFIKSIASVNRDFFVIYSGNGLYKLLKKAPNSRLRLNADPFKDKHSKDNNLPFWRGTVVGVDITLDQTREFSFLLNEIRKTYTSAIREKKRARYKRPRFIP